MFESILQKTDFFVYQMKYWVVLVLGSHLGLNRGNKFVK